ncbi:hypothetical protein D6833_03750 [Candidatus Parcubacteria bacterium]|nr:MAG: hypothetical protein D6833_03750 [Candidatus Parcubacteria bacterium]
MTQQPTYTVGEIVKEMILSAAMMGADLSPEMAHVFVGQLRNMGAKGHEIVQASRMVATEDEGRFTLKKLLKRIPRLQYPDAESAWSTFPKDEKQTGCVVEPALRAWGQAAPMWYDGDKIGARMAFKAAYEQFVAEAKQAGQITPKWSMTQGTDPVEREEKIREAAASGLISLNTARTVLPHLTEEELTNPALPAPSAGIAQLENLMQETDQLTDEEKKENLKRLQALKKMLPGGGK